MAEDLSFVRSLGKKYEKVPTRGVEIGTHTDCILKESLRPLQKYEDFPHRIPNKPFILSTSFPDVLPKAGRILLNNAMGIFVRGEFLALRVFGNKKIRLPLKPGEVKKLNLILSSIAKASPKVIYYRLMDYNPDEFTFLESDITDYIRGSKRLLRDKELLKLELHIIRYFKKLGKKVRVILPYTTDPEEQSKIQKIIKKEAPDQVGVMVERIQHLKEIISYPASDFLFPGPSDLSADYRAIKRGEYRENKDNNEVVDLVKELITVRYTSKIPDLLTIKILVDQIQSSEVQNVYNVIMPNQLISLRTVEST